MTPVVPSLKSVAAPAPIPEPLESLDRYKLVARLGEGGMAEVFLAAWELAPFVHRPVVVKRLHPHFNEDVGLVAMFLDEARLLTLLDHPHVVKTLEAGVIDGRCCIAMEYLEGQPLHRVLRRASVNGGLSPELAVSIAISVLDGLHYAHELVGEGGQALDIVHRDVSPQNIFVTNDGRVKILDFGIAKATIHEGRTATGIIKGKIGYIAPEQASAEVVDRRADVWSAGVVLWEALTSARLFKAETDAATLAMCLRGSIPSVTSRRPELPPELDRVLARALERDRAARYQSAGAMRNDLEAWLARAGHSRDARPISALMKALFAGEIQEQERLVSVLMARSDCTPPAPASKLAPSSTSALIMSRPQAVTSADLTRMNQQMEELGTRQRRAFRGLLVALALLVGFASGVGYLTIGKLNAARPGALTATQGGLVPSSLDAARTHDVRPPTAVSGVTASDPDQPQTAEPMTNESRAPRARAPRSEPKKPSSFASLPARPPAALHAPAVSAPTATTTTTTAATLSAAKPEATPSYGFLTIDTSPWSQVSVGGKSLGQTPLMKVKLPVGSQILTLRNPELGIETSYPVQIESGKTLVRRMGIE